MLGSLLIATLSIVPGNGTDAFMENPAVAGVTQEPDPRQTRNLEGAAEDWRRLQGTAGSSRNEVILKVGHPRKVERFPNSVEVWWYDFVDPEDPSVGVEFSSGVAMKLVGGQTGVVSNPMLQGEP